MTDRRDVLSYAFDFRQRNAVRWNAHGRTHTRSLDLDVDLIADAAQVSLPAVLADWIDIAFAAHVADRLSPRRSLADDHCGLQWRRHISATIAVRVSAMWPADLARAIEDCLGHLTGDTWKIKLVPGSTNTWRSEAQSCFPTSHPGSDVLLFSGGLDSFAGAAQLASRARELVLVSGVPNPRHGYQQRALLGAIRRQAAPRVIHVPVPYSVELQDDRIERTQRSRAFFHVTLGCVTALLMGESCLHVAENGVGAINLPLDATQLGTSNARASHPAFLLNMQMLSRRIGENAAFSIVNPFQFVTKAEACRHVAAQRLADCIRETFSCDGYPVRMAGKPQCGFCTACVLRRLAIDVAGLSSSDNTSGYLRDICANDATIPARARHGIAVMEHQVRQLHACLSNARPWVALTTEYPELESAAYAASHLLGAPVDFCRSQLMSLYRNHVSEWERFSARHHLFRKAA